MIDKDAGCDTYNETVMPFPDPKGDSHMVRKHGNVKDPKRYEAMRREGMSKNKAARIANSPKGSTSRKGGQAKSYEDWSRNDLMVQARKVGLEGRSKMSKGELIKALRDH